MSSADKHGDGKFEFANQNARVSIVWYDMIVPPEVCYEFCRTVPDAGFFGLAYGRQCYCTPYFKAEAGDSSQCDAVCEEAGSEEVVALATKMEEVGNDLKDRAGKEGDSISSAYGQMAVVYSGEVERGHEAASGLHDELGNKVKKLASFDGADFTDAKTIGEAEEAIAEVKKM